MKAILNGAPVDVAIKGIWSAEKSVPVRGGMWTLAPTRAAEIDVDSIRAAIDAATSVDGLNAALAPSASITGVAASVATSAGTGGGGLSWTTFTGTVESAQIAAHGLLDGISKYKRGFLQGRGISLTIASTVAVYGGAVGGATLGSGIWVTPKTRGLSQSFWHHEFAHALNNTHRSAENAAVSAYRVALRDAQPPGFLYGNWKATIDGHLLGFEDGYGATNIEEDTACLWAGLMDPVRAARGIEFGRTDAHLRKKLDLTRELFEALGLGYWFAAQATPGVTDRIPL